MCPKRRVKLFPFELAIFEKVQDNYTTKTVGVQKNWKEKDEYKSVTMYILLNDIPKLITCLQEVYKDEIQIVKEDIQEY